MEIKNADWISVWGTDKAVLLELLSGIRVERKG